MGGCINGVMYESVQSIRSKLEAKERLETKIQVKGFVTVKYFKQSHHTWYNMECPYLLI